MPRPRGNRPHLMYERGLLGGLLCLAGSVGCAPECNRGSDDPPVPYRDGQRTESGYQTSPPEGPYLEFPSGRAWEIFHGLGGTPGDRVASVSFQRCPGVTPCEEGDTDEGGWTTASGNTLIWHDANEESIIVRNDTCADFYLHVWLSDPQ